MIAQINGKLVEKSPTEVVIDCHGVGYLIHVTLQTFTSIKDKEQICLYTLLQIREDTHLLYGFFEKIEREVFKLLIGVNGVGASTARTMLSSLSAEQVIKAISQEDEVLIKSAKGIGIKTAKRIIIELKDKMIKLSDYLTIDQSIVSLESEVQEQALAALEVLGYNKKTANKVIDQIYKQQPKLSVEELIKFSLKKI